MLEPSVQRVSELVSEGFSEPDAIQYATDEVNQTGAFTPAEENTPIIGNPMITPKVLQTPALPLSKVEQKAQKVEQATATKQLVGDKITAKKQQLADPQGYVERNILNQELDLIKNSSSVDAYVFDGTGSNFDFETRQQLGAKYLADKRAETQAYNERDSLDAIQDIGLAALKGGVQLAAGIPTLGAIATGSEDLARLAQDISTLADPLTEAQSDYSQIQDQKVLSAYQKEYVANKAQEVLSGKENTLGQDALDLLKEVIATGGEVITNPTALANLIGEEVVPFLAGGALAKGAQKFSKVTDPKLQAKIREASAIGFSVAESGLANAQEAMNQVLDTDVAALRTKSAEFRELEKTMSPEEARAELATDVGAQTAVLTGLTTGAISKATGAGKLQGDLLAQAEKKGIIKAGVTESVEEAIEGGSTSLLKNTIVQARADETQEIREGVGLEVGAGGVTGGAIGSGTTALKEGTSTLAEGATKVADKVAKHTDVLKKGVETVNQEMGKLQEDLIAGNAAGADLGAKQNAEEITKFHEEVFSKIESPEEKVKVGTSYLLALQEKKASGELSAKDLDAIRPTYEKIATEVAELSKERAEVTKATVEKVIANPDEASEADTQVAFAQALQDPNVAKRLAGSKKLTKNQKTLLDEIGSASSNFNRVRKKTVDEVAKDVLEGSEGFTGLNQYIDAVSEAIKLDDMHGVAYVLQRLHQFESSHNYKYLNDQTREGKAITPELKSIIKDELDAIRMVRRAMTDTAKTAYPDLSLTRKKTSEEVASKLKQAPSKTTTATHSLPFKTKQAVLREALSTVLNPKFTPSTNAEQINNLRIAGSQEGLTKIQLEGMSSALDIIDTIRKIPPKKRTEAQQEDLKFATVTINMGYRKLEKIYGGRAALQAVLAEQGDADGVNELFASADSTVDLDTTPSETQEVHVALDPFKGKVSQANIDRYNKISAEVTAELDSRGEVAENTFPKTVDAFTDNFAESFNNMIQEYNRLEIKNTEVSVATGESKASPITPNNRVFQNVLDNLPLGSVIADNMVMRFGDSDRQGLLHTEANLFELLSDVDSPEYVHMTKNMSDKDKQDLGKLTQFVNSFVGGYDKTKIDPNTVPKNEGSKVFTKNALAFELMENGETDPSIKYALAVAAADWVMSSGRSTLYNDKEDIAKILGIPEGEVTYAHIKMLSKAGSLESFATQQIGAKALRILGWEVDYENGKAQTKKQLQANLGLMAINSLHAMGNGMFDVQYLETKGGVITLADKPTSSARTMIRIKENATQPEDGPVRLITHAERATEAMSNTHLVRDVLGSAPESTPYYMEGDTMPSAHNDSWNTKDVADAVDAYNEVVYEPDQKVLGIFDRLSPKAKELLLYDIPEEGTEHVNNTDSNAAKREAAHKEQQMVEDILEDMSNTGSKGVKFFSKTSKSNKRITQIGGVQNHKILRHTFKPTNHKVTIDPSNSKLVNAFKMAVVEALDLKNMHTNKGVDKSKDQNILDTFDQVVMKDKDILSAVAEINSPNPNMEVIESVLASLGGSAHTLDGLVALAQYTPNKPFETTLQKENDGITNGIAFGLLQYIGANSYDEWIGALERVGYYVGSNYDSYGDWYDEEGQTDRLDAYQAFAQLMTNILKDPLTFPFSDHSLLPQVSTKNALFSRKYEKADVVVVDTNGKAKKVSRLKKIADNNYRVSIALEEHTQMSTSADYFLSKGFLSDGVAKEIGAMVEEIARDFAKDPLMIFNYGAAIKGLKIKIANNIIDGVTNFIEEANKLQDADQKEAAFVAIEQAFQGLDFTLTDETTLKIDRENPLATVINDRTISSAMVAVEFTYGPAMEKAFDTQYGTFKEVVTEIIQVTRIATEGYKRIYDAEKLKYMEESGKDYLTPKDEKEILERIKAHSPMVATALSDDRLVDGLYVPKGDNTSDWDSKGKLINPNTDEVIFQRNDPSKKNSKGNKFTKARQVTYSSKIEDPGVSMGARIIQSMDATVILKAWLKNKKFLNLHDAGIFSLLTGAQDTKEGLNESFEESIDYDLFGSVLEMLESVTNSEHITDEVMAEILEATEGTNKALTRAFGSSDWNQIQDKLKGTHESIVTNKEVLRETTNTNTEYNGNNDSAHVAEGTATTSTHAERKAKFVSVNPTRSNTRASAFSRWLLKNKAKKARSANIRKDYPKLILATKFIGHGAVGTSTKEYQKIFDNEGLANTGEYTSEDRVFISANNNTETGISVVDVDGKLTPEFADIDLAIEAGSTFLIDRMSLFQNENKVSTSGDVRVLNYLVDKGYVPTNFNGVTAMVPPSDSNSIDLTPEYVQGLIASELDPEVYQNIPEGYVPSDTDFAEEFAKDVAQAKQDVMDGITAAMVDEGIDPTILEDTLAPDAYDSLLFGAFGKNLNDFDWDYFTEYLYQVVEQDTVKPRVAKYVPEVSDDIAKTALEKALKGYGLAKKYVPVLRKNKRGKYYRGSGKFYKELSAKEVKVIKAKRTKANKENKRLASLSTFDRVTARIAEHYKGTDQGKIIKQLQKTFANRAQPKFKFYSSESALPVAHLGSTEQELQHITEINKIRASNSAGGYSADTNTIYILGHLHADTAQLAETVLHEVDHAATVAKIVEGQRNNTPAYRELVRLHQKVKAELVAAYDGQTKPIWYDAIVNGETELTQLAELVAYGKSNKQLGRRLKAIKYTPTQNAFGRLLRIVRTMLGLDANLETAYETLVGLSGLMYDAPVSPYYQQVNAIQMHNFRGSDVAEKNKIRAGIIAHMDKTGDDYEATKAWAKEKYKDSANKAIQAKVFKALDGKVKAIKDNTPFYHGGYTSSDTITQQNIEKIYTELGNIKSTKPTAKQDAQLSSLLKLVRPYVDKINLKIESTTETNSGFTDGGVVNLSLNTRAKTSNLEMSPQELYTHELLHTVLRNADRNSRAWKEVTKRYNYVSKNMKPEHFLVGITNPTEKDIAEAQEQYEHTLFASGAVRKYKDPYLQIERDIYDADPVEEFFVMAVTNAPFMAALEKMDSDLKVEPGEGIINTLIYWFNNIIEFFSKRVDGLTGTLDNQMLVLAQNVMAINQNRESMLYKSARKVESLGGDALDFASEKVKDFVNFNGWKQLLNVQGGEIKEGLRKLATQHTIGKSNVVLSLLNEFTTGRLGLRELTRLLSKSTYLVERKSQQLAEFVERELKDEITTNTPELNTSIYHNIMETDLSSLIGTYTEKELIEDVLGSQGWRKDRIAELELRLKAISYKSHTYMKAHAYDLGYHMVTGGRINADGKYSNAHQIANLWGFDGRTDKFDTKKAEAVLDELATLHAVEFNHTSGKLQPLVDAFASGDLTEKDLNIVNAMHNEIISIARKTSFKDAENLMRKGYIRESFDSNVDVVMAPLSQEAYMKNLGYTLTSRVTKDPTMPKTAETQYIYVNEDSAKEKHLTGVLSLNNTDRKGIDLFKVGESASSVEKLQNLLDKQQMTVNKTALARNTYVTGGTLLPAQDRGSVAQPSFDTKGNIIGYRQILTHQAKDELLKRDTDYAKGLGYTLSGINRKMATDRVNKELMDYMYKTYQDEYEKYPDEFVRLDAKHDPDKYFLIPETTREYAKTLWGGNFVMVRREQMDISFGYRKFSVAQLQYDKSEVSSAVRKVLQITNNTATFLLKNKYGITFEKYWQEFIKTAKDVIVIKSGVVTAANIISNIVLLWWSGVPLIQAVRDHAEAYKATFEYKRLEEEIFRTQRQLSRPYLTELEVVKLNGKLSKLNQDLYNNPVRELMDAGVYQTIVEDVDTSENATKLKGKFDELIAPITAKTPEVIKTVGKNLLMTHDTKVYGVMRDMAQISDFAARYSLHKKNMADGMEFVDSVSDITTTFINYDIPSHKGLQYVNDMGLMGFTKYLFRVQQVLLKKFADNPARLLGFNMMEDMMGINIADTTDAALVSRGLSGNMYSPMDWARGSSELITTNLLTGF